MSAFQYKFFRTVYDAKELGAYKVNNPVKAAYCAYDNQVLQLVVSSLYISALFSGIIASKFARLYGRKVRSLFNLIQACYCTVACFQLHKLLLMLDSQSVCLAVSLFGTLDARAILRTCLTTSVVHCCMSCCCHATVIN